MPASQPPNLIFLFSDQHRGDWMRCAGHPFAHTPNLDQLAGAGTRFTQAYCNYPLCGPSRMSVMTGRHPYRNDITINEHCLPSDIPTMAHALACAGYETILAGRMHFSGPDQRHGFQKRYVGDLNACMAGGPNAMGPPPMRRAAGNAAGAACHLGTGDCPGLHFDEAVTRACEHILARPRPQPLFLTAGFFLPHHPFFVPEAYFQAALERIPADDTPLPPLDRESAHPFEQFQHPFVTAPDLTPEKRRQIRALYAAMITWLDERLGRVIDLAKQLPGETLILYSSDHGEFACDYDRIGKVSFLEPSLQVPLILARFQDGEPFGPQSTTCDNPVSLLDVAPTFIEAATAEPPSILDGDSLLPLLEKPESANTPNWTERPVFAELAITVGKLDYPASRLLRRGDFKLHYHHTLPLRLFNVREDPHEQHDLAGDPKYAALRDAMLAQLLDGWNPDLVKARARARSVDSAYLAEWGRQGQGPEGEVFDPSRDPTLPL
ncbi:MAG: sulfatase-like hydrolase/transferase [Opitutales bacterium]